MITSTSPRLMACLGIVSSFEPATSRLAPKKPRKLCALFLTQQATYFNCKSYKLPVFDSNLLFSHRKQNQYLLEQRTCYNSSSTIANLFRLTNMTNKPRVTVQQSTNQSNACLKSHLSTTNVLPKTSSEPFSEPKSYHIDRSPDFRTMAGIQKLATEPTREHIENIRLFLRRMNAKNNDNQQITLEKDHESGIAVVCIRSAAKNGISGRMMCDLLDIIDDLYSWNEGKGVIIYGHKGFFCSGE